MKELQRLFALMLFTNQSYVDPSALLKKITNESALRCMCCADTIRAGQSIAIGNQEDVSEFNDLFVQRIDEGLLIAELQRANLPLTLHNRVQPAGQLVFQYFAFRISHFAFRISHFAFRISHFAFRISHFAFRILFSSGLCNMRKAALRQRSGHPRSEGGRWHCVRNKDQHVLQLVARPSSRRHRQRSSSTRELLPRRSRFHHAQRPLDQG